MRRMGLIAAALSAAVVAGAARADEVTLLSHRAVYDLKLARAGDKSTIASASGRLVYQIVGSACEGYATQSRFVARFVQDSGAERSVDMRSTAFEDADGGRLDFLNQSYEGSRLAAESKGVATRGADGVSVDLTLPKTAGFTLPGSVLFPSQHIARMIDAARSRVPMLEIGYFDGTADGRTAYATSVVIGREQPAGTVPEAEKAADVPALAPHRSWPVRIGYFKRDESAAGESLPDYEFSAVLYDNGVSRQVVFDYGDYVLSGTLAEFTPLDPPPCVR